MRIPALIVFAIFLAFTVYYINWYNNITLSLFTNVSQTSKNRIFCMILTKPDNFPTRALTTLSVWASKCSDYRFVSVTPAHLTHPDNASIVKNSIFRLLHPKGLTRENYTELSTKVFYTIRDVYEEVGDSYDWYFKADDDTIVHYDNLLKFLDKRDPLFPQILGFITKWGDQYAVAYAMGGSGYLLSKAAFAALGSQLVKNESFCPNTGLEDYDVSICLWLMKIYAGNINDESNKSVFNGLSFTRSSYTNTITNVSCCSEYSFVSAHYMQPTNMLLLDHIFKVMESEYKSGLIPKPNYSDILNRYKLNMDFLNISENKNQK